MSANTEQSQTFLVIGATGKTGRPIVAQLRAAGHTARAASRNPKDGHVDNVKFDWSDISTFDDALKGVDGVYLIAASGTFTPLDVMKPLFDKALELGIRRFVFLSALSVNQGDKMLGKVHEYMAEHCPEWVVLRPNWFAQNLEATYHPTISVKERRQIGSAAGDGKISFIDCNDIASSAVAALTLPSGSELLNKPYNLTGADSLSYGEVATRISQLVGYEVKYVKMDKQAVKEAYMKVGLPDEYAEMLAGMDAGIADGTYGEVCDGVKALTGKVAHTFDEFAQAAKDAWL